MKGIILQAVANHFNMHRNDVRTSRDQKAILARKLAAYFMRNQNIKFQEIADYLWKAESCVFLYVKEVEEMSINRVKQHIDPIEKEIFSIKGYEWII